MPRFKVTLKRVIYADVYVEAKDKAAVRAQYKEDDARWQSFNSADSFHGENTTLKSVEPAEQTW